MGFLDPYAVDGATITGAQLRRQVFTQTKGETGVDGPEDLKVVAVAGSPGVAGVLPGGGVIGVESRRESYSVTNTAMDGDALIDVPPAGSSGATHYIIVEVNDPEFHGQEPGATPRLVSSLTGLTRPYLPLARIDLEAGEGFDATSTVVDLRRVANPRIWTPGPFSWDIPTGTEHVLTNESAPEGQAFPNFLNTPGYYPWMVRVPDWATHVTIIGNWGGVRFRPVNGRHGTFWARLGYHVGNSNYIGHVDTRLNAWNLDDATGEGIQRDTWRVADQRPVPAALRGTEQPVMLRGRRHAQGGSVPDSGPILNSWSHVDAEVHFTEAPI